MSKIARIAGMLVCIVLAILIAALSITAGDTLYLVYLVVAGLLGVAAGIIKNTGKR